MGQALASDAKKADAFAVTASVSAIFLRARCWSGSDQSAMGTRKTMAGLNRELVGRVIARRCAAVVTDRLGKGSLILRRRSKPLA